jgi:hypothetical protein
MFKNFKAQAWWMLARRFERTYRAVTEGIPYDPADLISLPSDLPQLRQIEKELSQATAERNSQMQLIVNKTPEGTKSPNLADAIVMTFTPAKPLAAVFAVRSQDITIEHFPVPSSWPVAYALKVEPTVVAAVWAAHDKANDIIYITAEHRRRGADAGANARAIGARGQTSVPGSTISRHWMPGFMETMDANVNDLRESIAIYQGFGLNIRLSDRQEEAGITDMLERLATSRFRIFRTCVETIAEYRAFRRDEVGGLTSSPLMDCARILARPRSISQMIVKPSASMLPRGGAHAGDTRAGY